MADKYHDLPRKQLQEAASRAIAENPTAEIHFKFTCQHCGERCTLEEPGKLYETGICFACGKETVIAKGGFMLAMVLNNEEDAMEYVRKLKDRLAHEEAE